MDLAVMLGLIAMLVVGFWVGVAVMGLTFCQKMKTHDAVQVGENRWYWRERDTK